MSVIVLGRGDRYLLPLSESTTIFFSPSVFLRLTLQEYPSLLTLPAEVKPSLRRLFPMTPIESLPK